MASIGALVPSGPAAAESLSWARTILSATVTQQPAGPPPVSLVRGPRQSFRSRSRPSSKIRSKTTLVSAIAPPAADEVGALCRLGDLDAAQGRPLDREVILDRDSVDRSSRSPWRGALGGHPPLHAAPRRARAHRLGPLDCDQRGTGLCARHARSSADEDSCRPAPRDQCPGS